MVSLPVMDAGARRRELERYEERKTLLSQKLDSRGGSKGGLNPVALKYYRPALVFLRAPKQHPEKIVDYPVNFVRAKPAKWQDRKKDLEDAAKERLKKAIEAKGARAVVK